MSSGKKSQTSQNSEKSSKIESKKTQKTIKIIKNEDKKFTYLIGDYGNNDFIFVTFTKKILYVHKNISYPYNKKTKIDEPPIDFNNLENSLQFGKWESKEYKYKSAYMSDTSNPDMNGYETKYDNFIKQNDCTYILVKLNNNNYLSLGNYYGRFTFTTPDNDNIKYVNWGDGMSKSGNLNAYIVGEKYMYSIPDTDDQLFYISNDNFKKYSINVNPKWKDNPHSLHTGTDYDEKTQKFINPTKPYLLHNVKTPKKILGLFNYNTYTKIKIYDVIHFLDYKFIEL